MSDRRNGAGSKLTGLLEKSAQPEQADEPGETESKTSHEVIDRGRGETPKKSKAMLAAEARAARKKEGRTIYIGDELYERITLWAGRKDKTISEYVVAILARQVPELPSGKGRASAETDAA
jgi:hypothetical protein